MDTGFTRCADRQNPPGVPPRIRRSLSRSRRDVLDRPAGSVNPKRGFGGLVVDGSAERAGTNARRLVHGAFAA